MLQQKILSQMHRQILQIANITFYWLFQLHYFFSKPFETPNPNHITPCSLSKSAKMESTSLYFIYFYFTTKILLLPSCLKQLVSNQQNILLHTVLLKDWRDLVMLFAFILVCCVIQEWGRNAYQLCLTFLTVAECKTTNLDCSKHLTALLNLCLMKKQSLYVCSNECKIGILNVIPDIKRQHYVICSIKALKALLEKLRDTSYLI